jgi:hypothetical protein
LVGEALEAGDRAHRPAPIAGEDALEDAGELPVAERHVVVDVAHVAARGGRVQVHQLCARDEALGKRGRVQQRRVRVAGLGPVHEQQAHVRERIAQRAELPVEHRGDGAVRLEQAVVEPVVAVDDRGPTLLGHPSGEGIVDLVDDVQVSGLRALPLAVPAPQLALDVPLAAAQFAEADGVGVDGVDARQHLGELATGVAPLVDAQVLGRRAIADDEAVHEAHDVERRAVDVLVGAQADNRRYGDVGGCQGRDDAVFPAHVVGGGQHVAQRRSAQDP